MMDEAAIRDRMGPPAPERSEVIPAVPPQVGDYGRLEWSVPDQMDLDGHMTMEREVWIEGEVLKIHRPNLDLIAEIRVDRSNFISVGEVAGIGIEHGARFTRIPRPAGDRKEVILRTGGTISGTVAAGPAGQTIKVIREQFGISTPAGTLSPPRVIDFSKGWIGLPDPDPLRPDGFDQSLIDEIKATMLATGKRSEANECRELDGKERG